MTPWRGVVGFCRDDIRVSDVKSSLGTRPELIVVAIMKKVTISTALIVAQKKRRAVWHALEETTIERGSQDSAR